MLLSIEEYILIIFIFEKKRLIVLGYFFMDICCKLSKYKYKCKAIISKIFQNIDNIINVYLIENVRLKGDYLFE